MMTASPEDGARWGLLLAAQVRENRKLFFRLAYGILRDTASADDVCQQALCRAWEERERIKEEAALRAWLIRVVVNESLLTLRRRQTEKRALGGGLSPRDPQRPPDESAALHESAMVALAALPEQTRVVVTLRIMDGRSGNEVKEMLGCSASEVSRRLHEGIDALRGLLAEWSSSVGESVGE